MARPRPIRWWLGILVAGVALPFLVLVLWLYGSQVQTERMEARDTALRIARSTATHMRTLDRDSRALLRRMAVRPAIRDFDGKTCDSLFAIVDFFPQFANLFLFDAEGHMVCSATPAEADRQVSAEARSWIDSEIVRGGLVPDRPVLRVFDGRWVVILAKRVVAVDGSRRGTLVLLELPDAIGQEVLPRGCVLTILDENGVILARSDPGNQFVGQRGGRVTEIALRSREGIAEAPGIDGVSRQYGFTYLPETGWYILIGLPTSQVMAPVRSMFIRGILGGAAIVLLVLLFAAMLSRAVKKPIDRLTFAAEEVSRGKYGRADVRSGPEEIVKLAAVFDEMVERRADAEHELQEGEKQLKALSDRLLTVQENERGRIARELHDDLGQSLTALKMDVIGLLQHSPESTIGARILRTIESTVTAVQRISSELRPSALDDLGLVEAIEAEAHVFQLRTAIECELSLPSEVRVDPTCATAIYRILQESLTNVARHSNATRVEIRLRDRPDELLLEVRDDGRGVTITELDDPASLGLIGIRERADLVGGSVEFEGVAGRGTIVSVRIPTRRKEKQA